MRLSEALAINANSDDAHAKQINLLCGFEPIYFANFVKAYLSLLHPKRNIRLWTGIYEDMESKIHRSEARTAEATIVALEWSDFDSRLCLRSSGGWCRDTLSDVLQQVNSKAKRILDGLNLLSDRMPVIVSGPTLSLPSLAHTPPAETSSFDLELEAVHLDLIRQLRQSENVAIVNETQLSLISPPASRYDIKMDLQAGCPYTVGHADALASLAVACLYPSPPKKGIITDLDGTLWKGTLGDDGIEGISWSLEGKSQLHALYQQLLASLADAGVLVAVASKNNFDLVQNALSRPDMLISLKHIFPIEANWAAKSDSVGRILITWNIDADSVVFVDDSPYELAEVAEKHPRMECLSFPGDKPEECLAFFTQIRMKFGKRDVLPEDGLRLASLRATASREPSNKQELSPDFLARLNARVTFEPLGNNYARSLELVNKTNQFNLNGKRYTELEWCAHLKREGSFTLIVSYEDRFGPLGRIAVISGLKCDGLCFIEDWVMSCRAFSRRIEFTTIRFLFSISKGQDLQFAYVPTERNSQIQAFLSQFFPAEIAFENNLRLSSDAFQLCCPTPSPEVIDRWTT